ncbi:MAG: SusD/RagB family nutrient-binding outer membrane lipoprotein [Bacteroidetes bacterium]|nr:SusD/RagB family nutrient-binding outer membrane lipoprotein [Bacteroidota bacterium]
MDNKFFKYLLLPAAIATMASSCSKTLSDAYQNPNASTRVPIENIFPSLVGAFSGSASSAGSSYGNGGDGLLVGRYIQYWNNYTLTSSDNGGTQYDQMGGTIGTSDNLGSIWGAFYYGQGQNLNRVIEWGNEEQKWDYVGGALAIRAWGWLELANEYGDAIVVKQAFNTSLSQFSYDPQSLAYDSCRAAAYKAIQYLSMTGGGASQGNFAIGDAYFYKGDVNKWKKFVYGVLARSFASLSNKSTYSADSVIKYCNLAMLTNEDNATVKFSATGISGTSSYYGAVRNNMGSYRQSAYIADLMSGRNSGAFTGVTDPRLWYMLRENTDSTFYGVVPGQEGTTTLTANLRPQNFWGGAFAATATATTGRYIFRDSAQTPIMTASEILFMKAEASFRKGDKTTALQAYTDAIRLNFDMLVNYYGGLIPATRVITPAVRDAYLANPAIVPTSANNLTLTHIMLQKYIALFGWGPLETWVDMRRYHYNADLDANTGKAVYVNFVPANGNFYLNNGGQPVYRSRPRYNSEYIYDIPSLASVGATDLNGVQVPNYHTKKTWFSEQ